MTNLWKESTDMLWFVFNACLRV